MREMEFKVVRERENPDYLWLLTAFSVSAYIVFTFLLPAVREAKGIDDFFFGMIDDGTRWGWRHISHSWFGEVAGAFLYFTPIGILLGHALFVIGILLSFGRAEFVDRMKGYFISNLLGILLIWSLLVVLFLWLLTRVFGGRNSEETLANVIKSMR